MIKVVNQLINNICITFKTLLICNTIIRQVPDAEDTCVLPTQQTPVVNQHRSTNPTSTVTSNSASTSSALISSSTVRPRTQNLDITQPNYNHYGENDTSSMGNVIAL